jgi:ligand-binding SRPBCC domain-containing protein
MAVIRIVTTIAAPVERCFDLARDIDFHTRSLEGTGERAVAGRTAGLIGPGESVTWEARHLGVRQRFTAAVTAFDRPAYFRDEMTAGAFRSFAHDHRFETRDGMTVMTDEVVFRSPLGPLGWLVDTLFMAGYLRRLLAGRCRAIKRAAEAAGPDAEQAPSANPSPPGRPTSETPTGSTPASR